MNKYQLMGLTISEAARLIKRGEIDPTWLVDEALKRIDSLNAQVNAFLHVMADEAQADARRASRLIQSGEYLGPLHGIPVGVKDLIDVAGAPTTAGSDFLRESIARQDAAVISLLKSAGAIIIGKTHLHEFAIGATNVNPHYGPARNPWNLAYSPGGSSGGSAAAVAASFCLGALGTDTGGSVRVPSALCGLTGIRPAVGRISTEGVIPMSWTLDAVGPMARTAEDAALLFDGMVRASGLESRPPHKLLPEMPSNWRLGVPTDGFFWQKTDPQIVSAVQHAIKTLGENGLEIVEVSLPDAEAVLRAAGVTSLSDAAAYHQERLEKQPERFGSDVRARLEWGAARTGPEYALACQQQRQWRNTLDELFDSRIDVLALPTTPVIAHRIEGSEGMSAAREMLRFTYPISLSGLPALSMPCGFSDEGFSIGLQLVAADEGTILQVAHAYQQITGWHRRLPSLDE